MEYTLQAEKVLDEAKRISKQLHHHYIGTEHLLIGLTSVEEGVAGRVLQSAGVQKETLIQMTEDLIYPGSDVTVMDKDGATPKYRQLLEQAGKEAAACGIGEIGTEHLLLALLKMQDCAGARLLNSLQINPQKLFMDIVAAMGKEGVVYKEEFS